MVKQLLNALLPMLATLYVTLSQVTWAGISTDPEQEQDATNTVGLSTAIISYVIPLIVISVALAMVLTMNAMIIENNIFFISFLFMCFYSLVVSLMNFTSFMLYS